MKINKTNQKSKTKAESKLKKRERENVVGNVKKNNNDYDLLNVIIICIGDLTDKESYKKTNNKLLKLLNVLLSKSLSVREKKELLVIPREYFR